MSAANLKFNAGDKVLIIKDTCLHCFKIGSVVEISGIRDWFNGFYSYEAIDNDGDCMLFDDDDCKGVDE